MCPSQAPVALLLSVSAPPRSVVQLLIFSTTKLTPLKVFSWKFLNSSWNSATLTSIPRPLNLAPSSKASTSSGLKREVGLQVRSRAEASRPGAVEVEAARLIAAREAGVGQQLVGRLVAQHRGSGELVLLFAAAGEAAVDRIERAGRRSDRREHLVGERARKRGNGRVEAAIAVGSAAAAAASALSRAMLPRYAAHWLPLVRSALSFL